nr:ATP-dependent DNA helicase PIF1-like [Parasteatoda tepidariorum]
MSSTKRTNWTSTKRGRIVILRENGLSYAEIAKHIGFLMTCYGVRKFRLRYEKTKSVKNKAKSGRENAQIALRVRLHGYAPKNNFGNQEIKKAKIHSRINRILDAPGGTGKTFIISLILAEIRSNNGIALAVASSGIVATLLDGGKTAHSVFRLLQNIQDNSDAVCNIKKQSSMATVLKQCKIIIWDECTMAHKHSLEALNRALKDIKNNDKLFGGTLLLLSGDFRQTVPVIPRSKYADGINAYLKSSPLRRNVEKVQLKVNMRVQMLQDPSAETFSKQLLYIGDGKVTKD